MRVPARLALLMILGVTPVALGENSPTPNDAARQAAHAFVSGHLPEAEVLYAKALQLQPDSASLLVSQAAVKTRLGKTDESISLLQKALAADWKNPQAWQLLGMNSLEKNHDDEALADLMQSVLRDPSNPRAHNYLGIAAGRKGWPEVSEQELRRAVELDPNYADAHFNLAVYYLGLTPPHLEMVRRHYARARELGIARDPGIEARLAKPASPSSSSGTPP